MTMQHTGSVRFFLGANSKNGFVSLYDNFTDPAAGDFLWVIKGGPGCGKSTFMKRIGAAAESAGFAVEYILCSGDPESLDGVYIPEKQAAYVDGTAPHVIEAKYPGAASLYLDLGSFLDASALESRLPEIMDLNQRYRALYSDAYRQLTAGAALQPKNLPGFWGTPEKTRLEKKLVGLAARELPKQNKNGKYVRRFLSARSCLGTFRLTDTVQALCPRVWALDNELGLGHYFLARLADTALGRGYDVILCPDPLEPEKTEAVLLPEAGLGFLTLEKDLPVPESYRHFRLDAMPGSLSAGQKTLLRQRRRESAALLSAAEDSLSRAKTLHDALEAVYRKNVDFSGLDALTEDHIHWLLNS